MINFSRIASKLKKNSISKEAITVILQGIHTKAYSVGYQHRVHDATLIKKRKEFNMEKGFREEVGKLEEIARTKWL